MRPNITELRAAVAGADPTGTRPDLVADAILAHWPEVEPMDVDEACDYLGELSAELGRVAAFVRDRIAGGSAGIPIGEDTGVHSPGACWCGVTHTVAGAAALSRRDMKQ